jgi:hypothetical protein
MTDTTTRHFTPEDIALLRAIVKWRKADGVEYIAAMAEYRRTRGYAVTWDYTNGSEIGFTRITGSPIRWFAVRSVTEAIDLIVTFGFLPARFSSAYRRGWDAGLRFEKALRDRAVGDEWHQVCASYPAVPPSF